MAKLSDEGRAGNDTEHNSQTEDHARQDVHADCSETELAFKEN
jgi:hypothetical protein